MSAFIDENSPFSDVNGKPLVNGFLYIGTNGADPKTTKIDIFSDRELVTPLANPQILDSFGRATNKIWIPARYSYLVEDENNVQKHIDLDAGETAESGITSLTNVQGTNTITAEASTAITEYVDKEIYIFTVINTIAGGGVTVDIDGVGPITALKNHNQPILNGEWEADQIVALAFNDTDTSFEWINQNNKVIDFYQGTAVASAATADIWVTDGNTVHLTGTTGVTSLGVAPNVGARRTVICDDIVTFTNSVNLAIVGGEDFTSEAGDVIEVYANTTTQLNVTIPIVNKASTVHVLTS